MKVMITGHTSPLNVAHMWYMEKIGEVFEVIISPNFPNQYYETVDPVFKDHQGHINFEDCQVLTDESTAYGTDCRGGCDT